MNKDKATDVRRTVRDVYSDVATGSRKMRLSNEIFSKCAGYTTQQICESPEESRMGLGCGNPLQIASLLPGEVVLDLGCGAGFDCFLAAKAVGAEGQVIGIDMTAEMIQKAKKNARAEGVTNVTLKLGEIERLPVGRESVDVILSNCVVNLSPEKVKVFQEAYRVLKPGGRLAIADIVAIAPLPPEMTSDVNCIEECVGGADTVDNIKQALSVAGFDKIRVTVEEKSRELVRQWVPDSGLENYIAAAMIEAVKHKGECHGEK